MPVIIQQMGALIVTGQQTSGSMLFGLQIT
jgi:hypothetical protein